MFLIKVREKCVALRNLSPHPSFGLQEYINVFRVMMSGKLVQGKYVEALEDQFSQLVLGRKCVAVNSGTSALHLSLLSLGIGPGDDVLVPSFTFAATANAVRLAGANPVFCDSDYSTFNIDPKELPSRITSRTKALMTVHLFGVPAAMDEIKQFAVKNGLLLIEDAAQAHGATYLSQPVGTFGDAACFSFYPTKNITSGEGGMIVFKNEDNARTAKLLRNQGMENRYQNEIVGFNVRMSELHAGIGVAQMKKLSKYNLRRRMIAEVYSNQLDRTKIRLQSCASGIESSYHQFTIVVPSLRDYLFEQLKLRAIPAAVYYPTPVHKLKPFLQFDNQLPIAEKLANEVLSLPINQSMNVSNAAKIANIVNSLL